MCGLVGWGGNVGGMGRECVGEGRRQLCVDGANVWSGTLLCILVLLCI